MVDTPLMVSCNNNHIDIVKSLIKKGANLNQKNKKGNTPLLVACYKDESIAEYLIKKKADIYLENKRGYSPLIISFNRDNENIIKRLINKDNKILNKLNDDGDTILTRVCKKGNFDEIKKY